MLMTPIPPNIALNFIIDKLMQPVENSCLVEARASPFSPNVGLEKLAMIKTGKEAACSVILAGLGLEKAVAPAIFRIERNHP